MGWHTPTRGREKKTIKIPGIRLVFTLPVYLPPLVHPYCPGPRRNSTDVVQLVIYMSWTGRDLRRLIFLNKQKSFLIRLFVPSS